MSYMSRFLEYLDRRRERWEREEREAYLSRATDLYDLERRICELDDRDRRLSW